MSRYCRKCNSVTLGSIKINFSCQCVVKERFKTLHIVTKYSYCYTAYKVQVVLIAIKYSCLC